jgi:TRAP-type C4-dicarboxylate transport system permease large subunit
MGYDPIWFAVIIVILLETGAITPSVGLNVFFMKGIATDVPQQTIFLRTIPYLIMMLVCLGILTISPDIALILPNLMKQVNRSIWQI